MGLVMLIDTGRLVLGKNECIENGLKTKMFVEDGRVMVRLSSETMNHHKKEYFAPAEDANVFYPLYFYYDFHYEDPYKDIILKLYHNAPKKLVKYIHDNFPHDNVYLKRLYDFEEQKPINTETNFILNSNEAAEYKLQQLGLKTWGEHYNRNDVALNFNKISKLLNDLESSLLAKAQDLGIVDKTGVDKNNELIEKKILSQATDEDLRLYIELGVAYRMNVFMSKVVRAQENFLRG